MAANDAARQGESDYHNFDVGHVVSCRFCWWYPVDPRLRELTKW
jgi:hypothetical protein